MTETKITKDEIDGLDDNIDDLLDEIDYNEKKEDERRASQILAEKEAKKMLAAANKMKVTHENENENVSENENDNPNENQNDNQNKKDNENKKGKRNENENENDNQNENQNKTDNQNTNENEIEKDNENENENDPQNENENKNKDEESKNEPENENEQNEENKNENENENKNKDEIIQNVNENQNENQTENQTENQNQHTDENENENDRKNENDTEKEMKFKVTTTSHQNGISNQNEIELTNWIRSIWKTGSLCEIYSNSSQRWLKGTIKRIFNDSEGEWLEVQYINNDNTTRCRETPRDDIHAIRPFSKAISIYKYVFHSAIKPQLQIQTPLQSKEVSPFGREQSPINIVTTPKHEHTHNIISDDEFHANPLAFNYPSSVQHCTILNNGYTVQVNIGSTCTLSINNKLYTLKQFHFHTPSEHTIDSQQYEMEMHLVHTNPQNEIAVLGFIFTTQTKHIMQPKLQLTQSRAHLVISDNNNKSMVSQPKSSLQTMHESDDDDVNTDDEWENIENPNDNAQKVVHTDTMATKSEKEGNDFLEQFWDELPVRKTQTDVALKREISFDYLFETASNNFIKTVSTNEINIDMEIFEYMGSLTTPPFTEGVQWLVSKKTHFMSKDQLRKLSACWNHTNNARDTQKYFGRTVSLRSKNNLTIT